jgi:hypothetical protein
VFARYANITTFLVTTNESNSLLNDSKINEREAEESNGRKNKNKKSLVLRFGN